MNNKIALSVLLLFTSTTFLTAQVGIGTTTPSPGAMLDVASSNGGILIPRITLTSTSSTVPISPPAPTVTPGVMVFNTANVNDVTEGFYYWNGAQWVALGTSVVSEPPIDSVTLLTDETLASSTTNVYSDIPGMTLTFVARKTSALVNLTASGFGTTNSLSIANIRVFDITNNSVIGGTMEKVQSVYSPSGPSTAWATTWSLSFSKLMTGLTIGTTYSIKVQGLVNPVTPGGSAVIRPVSNPNSNHLTLSVIQ